MFLTLCFVLAIPSLRHITAFREVALQEPGRVPFDKNIL